MTIHEFIVGVVISVAVLFTAGLASGFVEVSKTERDEVPEGATRLPVVPTLLFLGAVLFVIANSFYQVFK